MTPEHWITGDRVHSALRDARAGCRLVVGLDGPFEVWATSWGMHFMIPTIGANKMCPEEDLAEALRLIELGRP